MNALFMIAVSITKASTITMVLTANKLAAIGLSSPLTQRQSSNLALPIP